eukprot:1391513-Amphidinium_carterae.1
MTLPGSPGCPQSRKRSRTVTCLAMNTTFRCCVGASKVHVCQVAYFGASPLFTSTVRRLRADAGSPSWPIAHNSSSATQ